MVKLVELLWLSPAGPCPLVVLPLIMLGAKG